MSRFSASPRQDEDMCHEEPDGGERIEMVNEIRSLRSEGIYQTRRIIELEKQVAALSEENARLRKRAEYRERGAA